MENASLCSFSGMDGRAARLAAPLLRATPPGAEPLGAHRQQLPARPTSRTSWMTSCAPAAAPPRSPLDTRSCASSKNWLGSPPLHKVSGQEPVQVQQRQHLNHLRALPTPRRQGHRPESDPLGGICIDPLVVDPRRDHLDRTRHGGHHLGTLAAPRRQDHERNRTCSPVTRSTRRSSTRGARTGIPPATVVT
jgi:hypothetical protein